MFIICKKKNLKSLMQVNNPHSDRCASLSSVVTREDGHTGGTTASTASDHLDLSHPDLKISKLLDLSNQINKLKYKCFIAFIYLYFFFPE